MSTYAELIMDQGATFQTVLELTDDTTNDAFNVAAYTVRGSMRRSYYSSNVSANLICTFSDAANGQLVIALPAANTANLRAGNYLFDVQLISSNNVITRVLEGTITVTPNVTR